MGSDGDKAGVDELVLLAAPSCCGKTHFLERLQAGELPETARAMGIDDLASWISVIPKELAAARGERLPRLILHFAIPTIAINEGSARLAEEPRLEVVARAKRVTAVTMLASPATLNRRWRARHRAHLKMLAWSVPRYLRERRRMKQLKRMYEEPARIATAYEAWFAHVASLDNLAASWIITAEDDYEVFQAAEWGRLRRLYFATSGDISPQIA